MPITYVRFTPTLCANCVPEFRECSDSQRWNLTCGPSVGWCMDRELRSVKCACCVPLCAFRLEEISTGGKPAAGCAKSKSVIYNKSLSQLFFAPPTITLHCYQLSYCA